LSYTSFRYSDLHATKYDGDSIQITAHVENTGKRDGDEVVQVYVSSKKTSGEKLPLRSLIGFKRIHLKPGESREVKFVWKPRTKTSDPVEISVGGGQPDTNVTSTSNVIKTTLYLPQR
jgi:beta-glucosidase